MEPEAAPSIETDLLLCLQKIGKGMIASGISVGVVENTITEIALAYGMKSEVVALPNVIMLKLGSSIHGLLDLTVQRLTALQLDQVSELTELIDRVRLRKETPLEAARQVDEILEKAHRFAPALVIVGYFLSCAGLTMLFRPDLRSILVTGSMGILVGLMTLAFKRAPRFHLFLPVTAALVVSLAIFSLARAGLVTGAVNLIIPPLVTFLPGALLTTGMIELASLHILSGSARLIYGGASLFLLFIGISAGLNLSNLPSLPLTTFPASTSLWWAPVLGTFLFGIGTFVRLSGANRDLFWMLLVLYIAMVAQKAGESLINPYFGAFLAAMLMAVSSEFIARSPRRTPALVSQVVAFWFLVPGAQGLLSVTSILSENYQSALIGLGEMLILIVAIALGVLLGTLLISPRKFITPITRSEWVEVKS
jgi:uncharacterized membrane protein YjjP (DUF1212 family)